MANRLVGTLVNIRAVAARHELEAGVALAVVAAGRVAAAAAAAHVGRVMALVNVAARVAGLRRLVAGVAHAFVISESKSFVSLSIFIDHVLADFC